MEAQAGGNLRKNPRKEKDSHPDLSGTWTDTDGVKYWLSAWRNVDPKTGDVWFGLKLGKPVEQRTNPNAPAVSAHSKAKGNGFQPQDDDIPF